MSEAVAAKRERCWCGWRGRGGGVGHMTRLLWSVFVTGRTYGS